MKRLLLVVSLLVLAGCAGVSPTDSGPPDGLGEVGNVSYDAELDIDPSDGFDERELDRYVNRSMARIEVVRELEFRRPVDVTVVNRSEYRGRYVDRVTGPTRPEWENQIWRAMFIVGDDRDVTAVLDEAFGGSVQGFYEPGRNSIVIVSDSETPTISTDTLVHELTHALQDQQFGLAFGQESRDEQAAYDTLIEGEAQLVPELYRERCGEWSCLETSAETGGSGVLEPGIAEIVLQPYTQGDDFVASLKADGGWAAVNEAHENPPVSTAQTTYPERYPADNPQNVTVPDRSNGEWERFDQEPVGDTLGVVSIYTMFATNGIIEPEQRGSYSHPVTEGWDGDQIVPYRNDGEYGYVWELVWDSEADAREFEEHYRELLEKKGGQIRGNDLYVLKEGPYDGVYKVTASGDRVRIVHGPSRDALSAIDGS